MRKYIPLFTTALLLVFAVSSCKKDESIAVKKGLDNKVVQTTIAAVNGPTTGAVNQTLNFTIMWRDTAQYANFSRLEQLSKDNITTIKIFASGDSTAKALQNNNESAAPFKFKATMAGTYYLKFYKADNSDKTAIIDTVTVK